MVMLVHSYIIEKIVVGDDDCGSGSGAIYWHHYIILTFWSDFPYRTVLSKRLMNLIWNVFSRFHRRINCNNGNP